MTNNDDARAVAAGASSDSFRRVLGLPQVTMSGVAVIIGAGIFVLLGPATADAGGAVWLAFVIAAVLSALTALSYMELASMFPKASSEHEFTRHAFPRWVAAIVGWAMAVALIVAAATVALGFARYLAEFVDFDQRIVAVVVIVVMACVTYFGMEKAAWLIVGLAGVQIVALVFVMVIGAPSLGDVSIGVTSTSGVMSAAALVFFAFIGFDEVITLAEETRNPTRTVPQALMLALGISTLLYVGVAVAAVSVLGAEAVGSSQRPLADVGRAVVGDWGGDGLVIAALISTSSTVLLAITAGSRMLYGIARAGDLPSALATVRFQRVPLNALVLTVAVAVSFLFLGDLKTLASATDALIYGIFMVVNVVLVVLRFRLPDYPRPFKLRGAIGRVPVVPIVAFAVVVVVAQELEVESLWLAGVVIATGLGAHVMHRVAQRRALG